MKPVIVALLAVLPAAVSAHAGAQSRALSIGEAIAIGLEHSTLLRASAADVRAADARAAETATALLPSLRVDAAFTRLSDVPPFEVRIPALAAPLVVSPVVLDNASVRVGLQQPLFAGFRLRSNARAAELLATAAETDYRKDRGDVILAVATAYWTLHQTRQTRHVVQENTGRLERHLEDTRRLMEAGAATRNDYLRIDVQRSSAQLNLIDAENDVRLAQMNLNVLLGFPLESETGLTSAPADSAAIEVSGVVEGTGPAELAAARPDLRAMGLRVDAAGEYVTAARAGWWPRLALTANLQYSRPNQRYFPVRDEFLSTWDIGLGLQWDIWNWLAPARQTEQALSQLRKLEAMFERMKDNAALEVARARLNLRRAAEKIGVARGGVIQAEENARSLTEKYRTGLATSTEMLDAELSVVQASTNLTAARVEYEVAAARLEQALGSPSDGGSGGD